MITIQAVPTLESTCPASYQATEKTWGALGGTSTGNIQKTSEAPLTGQEDKPPSQAPTYTFGAEFGTVSLLWRLTKAAWSPLHIQQWPGMSHRRNLGIGPPQKLALV